MREDNRIDPQHQGPRTFLRVVGPLVFGVGGLFALVGLVDFFSAFGSMSGPPTKFWCLFVGMPLMAIGGAMTKFGYLGRIARYMSQEMTPVGTDTFNYAVDETKDSVQQLARAIGDGLNATASPDQAVGARCRACNFENEADARFCSGCGQPLAQSLNCPACGKANEADARFCDGCGGQLSG